MCHGDTAQISQFGYVGGINASLSYTFHSPEQSTIFEFEIQC